MRSSATTRSLALLTALVALLALPVAQASADSAWWQILDGSRPTHLWEPADHEQEIHTTLGTNFGGGMAVAIEVQGEVVGCLGTQNAVGKSFCNSKAGFPPVSTAPELEALLEGVYGTSNVAVGGGPVGSDFQLTIADRGALPLGFKSLGLGSASSEVIAEGGSGRLVLTITNLGDGPLDATDTPLTIVDELPEGVVAGGAVGFAGPFGNAGPVDCSLEAPDEVVCEFEEVLPSYGSIEVEVLASATGEPPAAVAPGEITVSGGDGPAASAPQEVQIAPDPVPYGLERFSVKAEEQGGEPATQAGAHPHQLTTTVQLNSGALRDRFDGVEQPAMPRNLTFPLPAGLIGNATAMPRCSMADFTRQVEGVNDCPDETAIGATAVTVAETSNFGFARIAVPVFNLPPAHGQPARFGFMAFGVPVTIDTAVDPSDRYRIIASVRNTTQLAQFLSSTLTIWGTPGDPRHDDARGWGCVYKLPAGQGPCERPSGVPDAAFLRMPVSCEGPLDFDAFAEPWNVPLGSEVDSASFGGEPMTGCNKVPFSPKPTASPTSKLAANATGLDYRLEMPNAGLLNGEAIAEGQPKKVSVALPEGMTINPSQAEGLAVCSASDYAREKSNSTPGAGCPDASKVGEVKISTPLLAEEARGSVYVAAPYENPFDSLIALYMVARIPERGILVKQAGKVDLDPATGQITTSFDQLPQLPFSSFDFRFRPGSRAPLITPPSCGTHELITRFVPWSADDPDNPDPEEIVTEASPFAIERGVDGGACPKGGLPPFEPELVAGTTNNAAGSFSPFTVKLTRKDGEQEITNFSIKLPPGVAGKLAGLGTCSDAAIARAASRTGPHGGREELEDPSCPASSQVGSTLAGSGVGQTLAYAPGKIYLAGPYNGAPVSFVAITAGVVGPFDIGTVVVRLAIDVNPETGEVFLDSTGSDPIPHIVKGVVLHLRDIRARTDRPDFTFNPTSCKPKSTAATVLGSGLDFASAADNNPFVSTSPFQAADCAALEFAPKLSLRLKGGTKRGDFPALKAFLRMRGFGEAGVARAQVTLPRSEFIAQAHFRTICTRVQFKAAEGNGEACPKGSIYGWARAKSPILSEPLEGPIFLRSSEHELPDVVASLKGRQIDVHLVGHVDSVKGQLRNTFETVPDAPVEWASFSFKGGAKGLFENSTNLCVGKHRADVRFSGQNGKRHNYRTALKVKCKGKRKAKGAKRAAR